MTKIVISGSGSFLPENEITNEELVSSFNQYVENYNNKNQQQILNGEFIKIKPSDVNTITRSSGIKKRRVIDKNGILDINHMRPRFIKNDLSIQSELGLIAARKALMKAKKNPAEINGIIAASTLFERGFPSHAIEIQRALNCEGWAYDMSVACSSSVFAMSAAINAILNDQAECVLVVVPEIYTGQLNFTDRKSHFIFGDGAAAIVLEKDNTCKTIETSFELIDISLKTHFSNNIFNHFGFLNCCHEDKNNTNNFFNQNGQKVREEIVPLVIDHLKKHLEKLSIDKSIIKRLWLHQANKYINDEIGINILGDSISQKTLPNTLENYGNSGAAGCLIAFDEHQNDLKKNDFCIISAFGAGYAIGSIILKKI